MKNPDDIEIEGEYLILIESLDDDDSMAQRFDSLTNKISELCRLYNFALRESGKERTMRLSLVNRSRFIAERMSSNNESPNPLKD